MTAPDTLKFATTHEWVRLEGDEWVVGISDVAQDMLGDLVFVGEVQVGAHLKAGATAGVVESVKAASDVYAPAAGTITAFNESLAAEPQQLNREPFNAWIFRFKPDDPTAIDSLLSHEAYRASVAT